MRKSFAAMTMRFIVDPMLTSQIPNSLSTFHIVHAISATSEATYT